MYFLPDQAMEYDRKRSTVIAVEQMVMFPRDEKSAIQWVRQVLKNKPQSFKEMQPQFMQAISGWQKHERPLELSEILEQNFLCYNGEGDVPSQIHRYLSTNWHELRNLSKDHLSLREKARNRWYVPDHTKLGDIEKTREKALLREFEVYRTVSQRRLKVFRLEAMRVGFEAAYGKQDYRTIIDIADKIPDAILEEDDKPLMFYDVARMRLGEDDTLGF